MATAMQTPETQILPIAPAYPDLANLTKWAGDLTRTLQQNLATIARKANDDTSLAPAGDINMNGHSITNILNLGNISGTITYKGADIDTRFVLKAGDTMTGKLTFVVGSTGGASWNMPAASGAPSSPADGDVWNDNVHYRVRLGGATHSLGMISKAETLTAAWTFATAASGQESIIIPHGAAPSAPTNGSLWSTTAAFFARINGATKTIATLETANTWTGDQIFNGGASGKYQFGPGLNTNNGLEIGYTGGTNTVSYIDFHTSATAVDYDTRILSSGNAGTVGGGSLTVNAAALFIDHVLDLSISTAGQIKFPATQNASTNANTLDDYVESTWTPGISFGNGTTGITYTTQQGSYTKIGRLVFVQGRVTLSSKGSSTGQARITGVPFTFAISSPGTVGFSNGFASLVDGIYLLGVATAFDLRTGSATGANVSMTDVHFTNTSDIIFSAVFSV